MGAGTGDYRQWIADRNGDGYPDDVTVRLVLDPPDGDVQRDLCAALLDLLARIGLETHALPLPLVSAGMPDSLAEPSIAVRDADDVRRYIGPVDGERLHASPLEAAPANCLTRLFTRDGALEDRDGDLLPDASRISFDIPAAIPASLAAALGNLAARIGLESGGVSFPLVRPGSAALRVRPGSGSAALRVTDGGWLAEGEAGELARLLERVARDWPHLIAPETGGARAALGWLRRALAGDGPEPVLPGEVVWEREWTEQWEVDALLDAFRAQLLPALDRDTPLDLTAFSSEPTAQRARLAATLRRELSENGLPEANVTVLCAFKAGLSWLREVVIPSASAAHASRVRISYQRYAPEGEPRPLDMPIRFAQELFPGTELLAEALGVPLADVDVVEAETDGATYVAEGFDTRGQSVGRWECTLLTRTEPFVPAYPQEGTVCVTTGGFIARQGQRETRLPVATDLERVWAFWQGEVMPRVFAEIEAVGGAQRALQPFFGALEAEVWVSEPNEPLGVREENDSAAEALHEDLYFNTLDAIQILGQHTTEERANAPGAVIPIVHVAPGEPPRARVRLRRAPRRHDLPRVDVRVSALRLRDDELVLDVTVESAAEATVARLRELVGGSFDAAAHVPAVIRCGDMMAELRLPLSTLLAGAPGPEPPMDHNIAGDDVLAQARAAAVFDEVTAWVEDRSYQGRPLVALALAAPTPGRLHSPTKAAIFKPTYLVIARHHANEISSTNAAFKLAWLCANDPNWRRYLDRVNVLVLPYENPDGAALHQRLTSDPAARSWKHHPARYNALGFEYGEDHFNPDTPFGESRARTAIYERWPADLAVDNHGVPAREWVQPFAGFGSPPRFGVSYWVPQALIYGIAHIVEDERFPDAHRRAVEALRDRVTAKIGASDLGEWNRVYWESYRFWGQSREPRRFPGEFVGDAMLWHISAVPPYFQGRSFDSRYPATTLISWVTEVNDETAEGEHLERVARAHLLANQATLDLLSDAAPALSRWRSDDGKGAYTLRVGRERPLRV
jgi:hypothetical protein